jgi:hypothetical protein
MDNQTLIKKLRDLIPIGNYRKSEAVISIMEIEKLIEDLENEV